MYSSYHGGSESTRVWGKSTCPWMKRKENLEELMSESSIVMRSSLVGIHLDLEAWIHEECEWKGEREERNEREENERGPSSFCRRIFGNLQKLSGLKGLKWKKREIWWVSGCRIVTCLQRETTYKMRPTQCTQNRQNLEITTNPSKFTKIANYPYHTWTHFEHNETCRPYS